MVSPQNPIWVYIYLFIYLFIYLLYKSYIKHRKKNRKIDRKEQSTRTQVTRNVREVTNRERVRQTYQSVSIDIVHSCSRPAVRTRSAVKRLQAHNSTVPRTDGATTEQVLH